MATDLALFSLESTAVFYGGMADSLLGTKMVPQWMKDDVDGFNNTLASAGKFAVDFVVDDKVRNQALDSMGKALHEGWDNFWADPAYNLGGAAFDIGSMLIGAGEIKAGLSAAKGSASFAKGVAAFSKTAGKAALKNADDMVKGVGRMISRGDDLTRKMAGNLKNKMVAFGDDLAGTASAGAQAVKQSLRQAGNTIMDKLSPELAFAGVSFSDDFARHGAKVYGMSDDLARQTGRVSSRFSTEAVEGGVSHADDVQGLLKGTGETVEKKVKSEFADGQFTDPEVQKRYEKYLKRKAKEGLEPRDPLDWKEASDRMEMIRNQGRKFELEKLEDFKKIANNVEEQVTIKVISPDGDVVRTRVDAIGYSKETGELLIQEFKSSHTAPLTDNQVKAFEMIEDGVSGTVVGKGKGVFKGGFEIPPGTEITVIRPD